MKDFLIVAGVGTAIFILIASAIAAVFYPLGVLGCASRWENSGFQHEYGFPEGCRISKDGKLWIPEKNYREIAD